jgi:hypothetical protein
MCYLSIYLPTYLSIYLSIYLFIYLCIYISTYVSMALEPFCWPWPIFSFFIYTQSVGLYIRGISPPHGRYLHTQDSINTEQTHTDIHASSGIRTHDPSVSAGEVISCLRPRCHSDRRMCYLLWDNFPTVY